jgi:hypothetical protein
MIIYYWFAIFLDQIMYRPISFLIFPSYFLTTYFGKIRFAEATSLFYSCCAREVICKFCGWSGNRWRAGGGRDPCPVTPCSLLFLFARPWELENFSTLAVSLLSGRAEFLRGGDVSRTARAGRSLFGHTRREHKCIASLLFVLIQHPGLWSGCSALLYLVFGHFLGVQPPLFLFVFRCTQFILFYFIFICLCIFFVFCYW